MMDKDERQPLILVHLVERRPIGSRFLKTRADWPLHVTLVPWFFVTPVQRAELIARLRAYTASISPFTVVVGEEKFFGPDDNIGVNVIADQEPVHRIHHGLRRTIESHADGYRQNPSPAAGIGSVYDAHITHHDVQGTIHRRFEGDREDFDDIALVTYFESDDGLMCEVVENFRLDGNG